MKTNITIKSISKSISIIFAIFLISIGSMLAQTDIKTTDNCIENDLAYSASIDHVSLDFYTGGNENPTEIEAWMSNTNFWENIKLQLEPNEQLKIEAWMSNEDYWSNNPKTLDNNLSIENWMMDANFWDEIKLNFEEPIQIESWMTDTDLWNNQENGLEIEAWMENDNYWTDTENEGIAKIENWMSDNSYWSN